MVGKMRRHLALGLLLIVATWNTLAFADAEHPTAREVGSVVDVLNFRSDMIADPDAAIRKVQAEAPRESLQRIAGHMETAGSGANGWRFLLGTSVFTIAGLTDEDMLTVFYNPWVDTALFTQWHSNKNGRSLTDVEWVPGDVVRDRYDAEIDPSPLWLRHDGYRPNELASSVVKTVHALEEGFSKPGDVINWRGLIGVEDMSELDGFLSPILAMRLYESQLRLAALSVPTDGEDPLLQPLREAVAALIGTAVSEGFGPLLANAKETTELMKTALLAINPLTMQGLAPVAFLVGDKQAMVFLSSVLTADFTIAARFEETPSGYAIRQLEYIPYAATYQAAITGNRVDAGNSVTTNSGADAEKSTVTGKLGAP